MEDMEVVEVVDPTWDLITEAIMCWWTDEKAEVIRAALLQRGLKPQKVEKFIDKASSVSDLRCECQEANNHWAIEEALEREFERLHRGYQKLIAKK